jgi:outer membrane protein TolC
MARLQRDAARADYYPTISAMGSYGYEGNEHDDTVDTWMIGAVLSAPIWDFYGRKGRLEQRASLHAQVANRSEDLRLTIVNEVLGTRDALTLTTQAIDLGEGAVQLALENLRYRQDQAKAGVASPMELNAAEVELAMAIFKEQETLYNHSLSSLRFWAALGDVEYYLDPERAGFTESTTTPGPSRTGTPD